MSKIDLVVTESERQW